MALSKRITLSNGVAVNYHRIASINTITNVCNLIEVAAYTSKAKRIEEKTAFASDGEAIEHNVFIDTSCISVPYDQTMTVVDAYDYIKTLPGYEGATDVLEGEEVPTVA